MMTAVDIMHPEDKKALQMLQKIPFIDGVCRSLLKVGYERMFRGENLAMMIKTSSQCLPRVYNLMKQTTEKIGLAMPEVYVYNDPVMNAFTFGETNVYVCISSSCVEKLDDEELMCLMAHECGHILCKHVLYKSVVRIIQDFGDDFGIIPYTLTGPIYLTLQYWSRRSEFSADRCAAATMGEKVFQRMTLKMVSGLQDTGNDYYQFVRQAKEYHSLENGSLWNKIQQNCRVAFYSHPQMVNRAYEIDRWKGSYSYKQLRSVLA